ncbi:AI-2E family transporter [Azonexus sp.]|jgi:predicted PurR-regulated permease PerM|uniref:AI-2E family transporter n=1 Tax=Azonexus sp. TaxID=1872668 RepID=UPI00282C70B5|nr:AI-2E family transporter [Azonexus sp.]MDR1994105.1 AI-2E family transporter [Azonexus sp.]
MLTEFDPKRLAQIALVVLLIVGCIAVVLPFVGAILFAFVIWICSWNFYRNRLLPRLGGRRSLGASLMVLILTLILILPTLILASSLASGADGVIAFIKFHIDTGLHAHPPAWLAGLPLVGDDIDRFWQQMAGDREALNVALKQLIAPARGLILAAAGIAANGLLQMLLVLFVAFFLFRDGEILGQTLAVAASKLGGELGAGMLVRARDTVLGVMVGLVGTAAAQGTVAIIGFLIAGVPGAMVLGFATFFLSMMPAVGPPLIWGGVAIWLYSEGQTAWAIFMVLYGVFAISSIDNLVKPILMARGAGLSVLLVALGVLGGVLVFGFIGIFLGPVLLALGQMLFSRWIGQEPAA